MMRFLILFLFIVNCVPAGAQFTYFNQITGEFGDLSSEICANVELANDGYVIWGAEIDDNVLKHFMRKYSLEGEVVYENNLTFENEYLYTGIVASMQWNPYTNQFVAMQGSDMGATTEARLLTFNENLELEDNLYFDNYDPFTYFLGFLIEPDGYVVMGETASIQNTQGTFLMKLDFEGNVIWNQVLQPDVYQHIFRNWNIIKIDSGYLVFGGGSTPASNFEPYGLITETNETGATQNLIIVDDSSTPGEGYLGAIRLVNNKILVAQVIAYELVDPNGNPNIYWRKVQIFKFNPSTQEMYDAHEYFNNYEFQMGNVSDMVPSSDGGALILGTRQGSYFDYYSWMMKIDAEGNEEWFHEYTYQDCDNCFNLLYDLEKAPDGGYIAAGQFANYDIDPRNATWLLKVDACGDVEWQGCEIVGVEEKEAQSFSVYPNPNTGRFTVEAGENARIASWSVYNLAGQKVARANVPHFGQSMQINLNLPSGLYALELVQDDGKRENHKIQIVK